MSCVCHVELAECSLQLVCTSGSWMYRDRLPQFHFCTPYLGNNIHNVSFMNLWCFLQSSELVVEPDSVRFIVF